MAQKKCNCCGQSKDLTEFYKRGRGERRAACVPCHKQRKRVLESRPELRYKAFKRSAKRREYSFVLTLSQFKKFENKSCRYCGAKVSPISLDRINNNIGYEINNVDSCCVRCNSLKHTLDEHDFLSHIAKIYEFQRNKAGLYNE